MLVWPLHGAKTIKFTLHAKKQLNVLGFFKIRSNIKNKVWRVWWVLSYIPVQQEGQNQLIDFFTEIKKYTSQLFLLIYR